MTATLRFLPPTEDIFASKAAALTVTVNCVSTMGAGLAKAFAQRFPWVVKPYQDDCRKGMYHPGQAYLYAPRRACNGPSIICAATKDHWKAPSQIEWVADCMTDIRALCLYHHLPSVAIPALGVGHGGLPWNEVRPIIERVGLEMVGAGVDVEVYDPHPERPRRAGRGR